MLKLSTTTSVHRFILGKQIQSKMVRWLVSGVRIIIKELVSHHVPTNYLESVNSNKTSDTNRTGILNIIEGLTRRAKINKNKKLDFDDNDIDDNDYTNTTGMTRSHFDNLRSHIKPGTISN